MQIIPDYYLYKRIVQAKLYMDANYAGHIHLDTIAGEASFSKFHFIRLFRQTYGKTPHQYLTRVRMEKAKQLLSAGMPVAETCYALGFGSHGSFTSLFKRYYRISPLTYCRQQQQRFKALRDEPLQFVPNCFISR